MQDTAAGPAATEATVPEAVVFDIGNVLVRWDPRRLYRRLLPDEAAVEEFLATVCTPEWNAELDRGRPYDEAVATLAARHPDKAELIAAYRDRWPEMLGGPIPGSVAVLEDLIDASVPCYALTNFSAETWPVAYGQFAFLRRFDGVVVSGMEGITKPDPVIYGLLAARFGLRPPATLFVDDLEANVRGAIDAGFQALKFESAARLRLDLRRAGLPV